MKHSEYSAIVVGSGAAGLYAALKLAQQIKLPEGILLVTKSILGESNSKYAQGGIVAVMNQNTADSVQSHVEDTLKAGAGLSDKNATTTIAEFSDEVLNDMISNGVIFDKDENGNLTFTLEAAHSVRRILHSGGDATGKGIVEGLKNAVLNNSNIIVKENSIAVELLINNENSCKGLIIFDNLTGEHEIVYSSAVILASGGFGQVYKYTTNPTGATGDGIDIAYNAGAILQDMEFVQFHPTALALSPDNKNRFLISEAVRGEGAILLNNKKERFMPKYHEKKELAPRDVVTRAIYNEMQTNKIDNVLLDATCVGEDKLIARFPNIHKICLKNGINISKQPIPVAPAAHYTMGGIKATTEGKTNINGLYAIGECASTGLHGANRLASNSLLECVVCAYELANYLSFTNLEIPKKIDEKIMQTIELYSKPLSLTDYDAIALKQELKEIMWNNAGIIKNETDLNYALEKIKEFQDNFKRNRKCLNKHEYEYRNMLTAAYLVVKSAIVRKESRGAHSRSDYPSQYENPKHSELSKKGDLINA